MNFFARLTIMCAIAAVALSGCAAYQAASSDGALGAAASIGCASVTKTTPADQLCNLGAGVAITVGDGIASGQIKL